VNQRRSWSQVLTNFYAGLTETSTVVLSTPVHDIWFGSCGSLLPSCKAKLVSIDGTEITGYNQPGELVITSPSVVLGYLNNDQANKEIFQDGWMRTGDEVVVRKGPNGNDHFFIVDRIKELIKVKVRLVNNTLFPSYKLKVYQRVCKLHLLSSKPIYLPIRLLLIAVSSPSLTMLLESCPRLT